jgi:HEAT repeat protein
MMADDEVTMSLATLQSKRGGPAVRAQAARMLGELGDPRAVEPLLAQIEDTADPFRVPVITAALEAIPRLGAAAEPALLRLLDDRADARRRYVPRLLISAVGAAAAPVLVGLVDDADDEVAMNAATALGSLRDPAFAPPLQAIVDDPSRPSLLRGVAASALGMSGSPTAYNVLAPLLGAHDPSLLAGAIDGLAELSDPRAAPLIQALLATGRLDERTARGARLALISLRTRR